MEDPKLYELGNAIPFRDSLELIPKYLPLLQWWNTEEETAAAVDIGCGTGNVTWEILHSLLPKNVRLYGSDIEPRMVEFAARKYPELKSFVLDIATRNLPERLHGAFDNVFSFYCLMWIRNSNTSFFYLKFNIEKLTNTSLVSETSLNKMEDPKLYELGNGVQYRDSLEIIPKYLPLLQWRNTKEETAVDIGCGTGNITWEILHSLLPKNVRLYGSDIQPRMVEFAATKYPELKTFVLDICTKNLPEHLHEEFNFIFSFYCLMWISDTNSRQAMQNIYDMLKPGGQFFTHYLVSHCFFDTFNKISTMDKWKNYVLNNKIVQNYYDFDEENISEKVRKIMENIGFEVPICQIEYRQAIANNLEELKNNMAAVMPGYPQVPEVLKEKLMNDAVEILFQHTNWMQINQKSSNKYFIPYRLIIIVASKSI